MLQNVFCEIFYLACAGSGSINRIGRGKPGFFQDEGDLRTAYVEPYVFPRIVGISLIERPDIVGDQKDLVLMDVIHPFVYAKDSIALYYKVQDYPVLNEMFIRIEGLTFVASQLIQIEIIRILIIYKFAKITSLKF